MRYFRFPVSLLLLACCGYLSADDAKAKKGASISLGEGAISMMAPSTWEVKKPRSRIVQYEFAAPVAKDDKIPGRVTIMGAGGSIDDNLNRWMGQFVQTDGKTTKQHTKVTKKELTVGVLHVVDITGTFMDRAGGPFTRAPTVKREGYRMLGAIIVTPKSGQYFVKLYGPKATIESHAAGFRKMVEGAKARR
jgi:hypothetical protein